MTHRCFTYVEDSSIKPRKFKDAFNTSTVQSQENNTVPHIVLIAYPQDGWLTVWSSLLLPKTRVSKNILQAQEKVTIQSIISLDD